MALDRIEGFCNEFKPSYIHVFVPVVEKLDLPSHIEKYLKESLQDALKPITVFIADQKRGFPHGGESKGDPKPITEVLRYLVSILSKMTNAIEYIYKKMDDKVRKSYSSFYGYPKKWVKIEDQFVTAYEHWEELIEPLTTMIASTKRTGRYHPVAQSRVVKTFNRFNKHLQLPTAQLAAVQNHYEENIPMATVIRPSLSPRTRKSKRSKRKNTAKGTRI